MRVSNERYSATYSMSSKTARAGAGSGEVPGRNALIADERDGDALNQDHLRHGRWTCGWACNDLVAHMRTYSHHRVRLQRDSLTRDLTEKLQMPDPPGEWSRIERRRGFSRGRAFTRPQTSRSTLSLVSR